MKYESKLFKLEEMKEELRHLYSKAEEMKIKIDAMEKSIDKSELLDEYLYTGMVMRSGIEFALSEKNDENVKTGIYAMLGYHKAASPSMLVNFINEHYNDHLDETMLGEWLLRHTKRSERK